MRSKISLRITMIIQAVFLALIALEFICIWAVTAGVPYIYAFVLIGLMIILFAPVEIICFLTNLVFLIMDLRHITDRSKLVIPAIITVLMPVFIIAIKILLDNYGSVLVPFV